MKIIQLTAENLKRLKAVTINPDGSMVQITGKNAQGKSSVLDAIAFAIGGKDAVCAKPVRKGESKARIVCQFEDLVVTRTFTAEGGGTLTVTTGDGEKCRSPQELLDKMVGRLTLDPLEFIRLAPKKQAEMLRSLVGLDFAELEQERQEKYSERTGVNRDGVALKARYDAMPHHGDAPAESVSVSALVAELQRADQTNSAKTKAQGDVDGWGRAAETVQRDITGTEREIKRLMSHLEKLKVDLAAAQKAITDGAARVSAMPSIDTGPLKQRISDSENINRKVRENLARKVLETDLQKLRDKSQVLTDRLAAIDKEKSDKLAAAEFPVDGLAFDEDGVTFKAIPFEQASSAEQLRVSVAIGLALNPKLRVLLIRDGSLLDADGLKALAKLAEESDCQVWLERVAEGSDVGVVIEDGCVKGAKS